MPDMPVMISTVKMSMNMAAITHVAITLLALIPRVAMTAPLIMNSLVHSCANVRMVIAVTDLNVPISTSVQCHHVMRMPPTKIL